jgi:hypothetical protein
MPRALDVRMKQAAQEPDYGFNPQKVALAQGELKLALMFAGHPHRTRGANCSTPLMPDSRRDFSA